MGFAGRVRQIFFVKIAVGAPHPVVSRLTAGCGAPRVKVPNPNPFWIILPTAPCSASRPSPDNSASATPNRAIPRKGAEKPARDME